MPQIDLTNFFFIVEVLFFSLMTVYIIFVLYLSPIFYNMLKSSFYYTLNSIVSTLVLVLSTITFNLKLS
jgi:hypothetical protein